VEWVLGKGGPERGQFKHLVTERLRVAAGEGLATATASRGLVRAYFVRGQQGAAVKFMSGLSTATATGGFPRGAALDGGCITAGGPGGVLGVWAEAGVEVGHLRTPGSDFTAQGSQEGKESGLGSGRDLIPKVLGDGRLLRHAPVVGGSEPAGHISGREPLRSEKPISQNSHAYVVDDVSVLVWPNRLCGVRPTPSNASKGVTALRAT
jgi:hypothetical protein